MVWLAGVTLPLDVNRSMSGLVSDTT